MKIRKIKWKTTEDKDFPRPIKHILGVKKVAEIRDPEGNIVEEEYEIIVLE